MLMAHAGMPIDALLMVLVYRGTSRVDLRTTGPPPARRRSDLARKPVRSRHPPVFSQERRKISADSRRPTRQCLSSISCVSAYKDPLNKDDGSWRLIYVNAAGQIIGSTRYSSLQQMALLDLTAVGSAMRQAKCPGRSSTPVSSLDGNSSALARLGGNFRPSRTNPAAGFGTPGPPRRVAERRHRQPNVRTAPTRRPPVSPRSSFDGIHDISPESSIVHARLPNRPRSGSEVFRAACGLANGSERPAAANPLLC